MANTELQFADKYRLFLKKSLVSARDASGGREVCARCKYCEDSTDFSHGHMYIKIPQDDTEPSVFYCQKCKTSGIVNNRTLIEWGCYDPEIATELNSIYGNIDKAGKVKGYNRNVYRISNCIYSTQLAQQKLLYLNNRLGTNLTLEECVRNKIIFNLGEVLEHNHINQFTRHESIIRQLNDNFIGFLSLDNNFVNLRKINDNIVYSSIDKRYVNYNIFDKKDNTEKFYVMPVSKDLSSPIRFKIHIAEGPIDILSIKYNLRKSDDIYAAIGGSGYKGLIMYLMNTLKLFYIELHVYPDNDKHGSDRMIKDLSNYLYPYHIPLYVHRNTFPGEKDMGVPLSRIKESIVQI